MKLIVAINNLGVIGKGTDIPWRCSEDLKHFKRMTLGCTLAVGSTTSSTLPPLKDRVVLIVSSKGQSLEEVLAQKPDWIIGGASLYEQTVHLCDEIHISFINDDTPGDKFFAVPEDYKGLVVPYYFETNSERR